jgi:ArsR family transcriptional regulator
MVFSSCSGAAGMEHGKEPGVVRRSPTHNFDKHRNIPSNLVEIFDQAEYVVSTMSNITGPDRTQLPVLSACCPPATSTVPDKAATTLASLFKALADPARVKIMSMLLNADEMCACDVAAGIGKSAATTSHHLNLLRTAGLVTSERRGTWIYYRVLPERLEQLSGALRLSLTA